MVLGTPTIETKNTGMIYGTWRTHGGGATEARERGEVLSPRRRHDWWLGRLPKRHSSALFEERRAWRSEESHCESIGRELGVQEGSEGTVVDGTDGWRKRKMRVKENPSNP